MVQRHIAVMKLLVSHQQLAKAIEAVVRDFNDPAPDLDSIQYNPQLPAIMPAGSGRDERQRDATSVHQQVAFTSISPPIRWIGSFSHCRNRVWIALAACSQYVHDAFKDKPRVF